MKADFVLFNSFDRSGSTLLSKALANHPNIETLFNPFNATVYKYQTMAIWDAKKNNAIQDEGEELVRLILEGDFSKDRIKSRVFFPHSSTHELIPGSLHVIKTTNFHAKIAWFKELFPSIKLLGLIRSPIAILASLVRNGFHTPWYGGWGHKALVESIHDYHLSDAAVEMVISCTDEVEQMACIIGCLNGEMIRNMDPSDIIRYEDVIDRPNEELASLLDTFKLQSFDFKPYFEVSVNSSGKQFGGRNVYSEVFTEKQIQRYSEIFDLLGNPGY